MNIKQTISTCALAAAFVFSSAAFAQAQVRVVGQDGSTSAAQNVIVTESGDGGENTIEVRIVGEDVKVTRNGKEVSGAQVIHEQDGMVILDKEGKQLQKLNIKLAKPGQNVYSFTEGGDGDHRAFFEGTLKSFGFEGENPKVMLGVHLAEPPAALCKHLRIKKDDATMITGVFEGLPAHDAGIGEYDVVIRVNGKEPADMKTIRGIIKEANPGESLALTVIQSGKENDVKVKLIGYDANLLGKAKLIGSDEMGNVWFGTPGVDGGGFTLPKFEGSVFIAPQASEEVRQRLQSAQGRLKEIEAYGSKLQSENRGNLDERLKKLDQRMADLEKLLQRLVERERNR